MKKNSFIFSVFLLTGMLVLFSCKKEKLEEPDNEVIIPSTTKLIPATVFNDYLHSISADTSVFTFTKGSSAIETIEQGNIIVSEAGYGYLLKVLSVQKEGDKIILSTQQASMAQAIQKGHGSVSRTLSMSDVLKQTYLIPGAQLKQSNDFTFYFAFSDVVIYDDDGDTATHHDQVTMDGFLGVTPSFMLELRFDGFRLVEMTLSQTFAEEANIGCTFTLAGYELDKEVVLASYQLQPIVFFIGWLPVIITPNLEFRLGVNGEVSATITAGVSQNASVTGGVGYKNGAWTPFVNETHEFIFQPPSFNAEAMVKGYLGPQLNFLLYGMAGPYGQLFGYKELNIGLIPEPSATLYEGLELNLGVYVIALDHKLVDKKFPGVLGIREKVWEQTNLGGKISGIVKDAITAVPLHEVEIKALKEGVEVGSANSTTDGTYELSLPAGSGYEIRFIKLGYLPAVYENVEVVLFGNTVLEPVLQIDENFNGIGSISGMIINALTGNGVSGITLDIREGINATTGEVIQIAFTDSYGNYSAVNLEAGHYTVEARGSGYSTTYFTVICIGSTNTGGQNATITPLLPEGEIRIILTWGDYPWDLDSHFTGPLDDGTRFHMYYPFKGYNSPWPNYVILDLDDVSSYGPETTTLYYQLPGVYRFSVHDFTNRDSYYSLALSNSSAQVKVYGSAGLMATFNIPPNQEGTLWTVFEMGSGIITPINTFSYVTYPGGITAPFPAPVNEFESFPEKR